MTYLAPFRQTDQTGTRTLPLFDSYPDSDDDFDFDSDLLGCRNLSILATPQSQVVFWKDSELTSTPNKYMDCSLHIGFTLPVR